jgi:uncharacterized protein (TIGR02246 family)
MTVTRPQDLHPLFVEAFNAGDLPRLLALYEPGARLVAEPGQVLAGHEAIRNALQQFLALRGTITMDTKDVVEAGDIAMLRAKWRLNGTGPDGKPVDMQGNSVEIIRRQSDGRWLFAVDHPHGGD